MKANSIGREKLVSLLQLFKDNLSIFLPHFCASSHIEASVISQPASPSVLIIVFFASATTDRPVILEPFL